MDGLDFVVVGLAQCWQRDEDNQLSEVLMVEPVPSAAFLALLQDIPSSFSRVMAVEPDLIKDGALPQGFPQEARFPVDFEERLWAAARTFKHDPNAKNKLKLGDVLTLNRPPKDKRIINQVNVVRDDDNVKQHPMTHQSL